MKKVILIILLLLLVIFVSCKKDNEINIMEDSDWTTAINEFNLSDKTIEISYENSDFMVINESLTKYHYLEVKQNEVTQDYYLSKDKGITYIYEKHYNTWIKHILYFNIQNKDIDYNVLSSAKYNEYSGYYELSTGNDFYQVEVDDKKITKIKIIENSDGELIDIVIKKDSGEITLPTDFIQIGINQETVDFLNATRDNEVEVDDIGYDKLITILGVPDNEEHLFYFILLDWFNSDYQLSVLLKDGIVDVAKIEKIEK